MRCHTLKTSKPFNSEWLKYFAVIEYEKKKMYLLTKHFRRGLDWYNMKRTERSLCRIPLPKTEVEKRNLEQKFSKRKNLRRIAINLACDYDKINLTPVCMNGKVFFLNQHQQSGKMNQFLLTSAKGKQSRRWTTLISNLLEQGPAHCSLCLRILGRVRILQQTKKMTNNEKQNRK